MTDNVNHPEHYTGFSNGAEVIDITENLSFNLGNVVKYVARAGRKTNNPLEDLLKAQWYLDREIERSPGLSVQSETIVFKGTPRTWDLLDHIPPGVNVRDRDGDLWKRINGTGQFQLSPDDGASWGVVNLVWTGTDYGPFIEAVE